CQFITSAGSQQVDFAASVSRSLRFSGCDLVEALPHVADDLFEAASVEHFDQELAAGFQPFVAEIQRQFGQVHGVRLIDVTDATDIGGHVGNNKVYRFSAEGGFQLVEHCLFAEIALNELYA